MSKCKVLILSAVVAMGLTSMASAATYCLEGVVTTYAPDFFTVLDVSAQAGSVDLPYPSISGGAYYQVDLYLVVSGFNAGNDERGFGNMLWDFTTTNPAINDTTLPGWFANNPVVVVGADPPGPPPAPTAPLWNNNQDGGVDTANLLDMLLSIAVIAAPQPEDPRDNVGMPSTLIGTIYLDNTVDANESATALPRQASYAKISDGQFVADSDPTLKGFTVNWVPEPTSIALLGLGGLALLARRRSA